VTPINGRTWGPCVTGESHTRVARLALLFGVVLIALLGLSGCANPTSPGVALSVEQALTAEDGRLIRAQGQVVATEADVVLASALLESYPPQAGGAILAVKGLDLAALVGLSSTVRQPGVALVTWSDFEVVLEGVVKNGTLEVESVPRVIEAGNAEMKVRFSAPVEPLVSGEMVWWVFDVTNLTGGELELTFPDGQTGEVVLAQSGEEKYRWSEGKAFIEAIRVDTIEPGGTVSYWLNDLLQIAPGVYDLKAMVTASAGPEGTTSELPQVATTVKVR
jgi:hypothetical protein